MKNYTSEEIKNKMIEFFQYQVDDLKRCYKNPYICEDFSKAKLLDYNIQQMLAVSFFCQKFDIEYEEIDKLYTEYREKLDNLYKEYT